MSYNHESHWPHIQKLAEAGLYQDLHQWIEQVPDLKERVALYRFTVRGLMFRNWTNKDLKPIVLLGDAGIETALKDFQMHPEDLDLKDEANIICYNMSSNLAGCWNDGFNRTAEHFKKGLQYAERALVFRKELKKGPRPFSIAYWAKGIHQLFLGDALGAEQSFTTSLKYAEELANAANLPTTATKKTPFDVLLQIGYVALARLAQNNGKAEADYQNVIKAFEGMKSISEDAKADAEMGLEQLRNVHEKIVNKRL